jgi:monoamine oxidase
LAGSEFSDEFSGYLEGAVRSAEAAVKAWRAQALVGLNPF